MKEAEQIEHEGVVKQIEGNKMQVSILSKSACLTCAVKGTCHVSEVDEKIVDVYTDKAQNYKLGERVDVYYAQSLGFRALFLGYVLPFLLALTTLIITYAATQKEGFSGLLSIIILVPYYLSLYFTKKNHEKKFSFSVKKSSDNNYKTVTIN